jgi:hypothetical protein
MLYVKNMGQLDKNDLAQMNEDYFKSLAQERLVEVAKNLHALATELWEKQQQNSANSSQPPSKNNPYTSFGTLCTGIRTRAIRISDSLPTTSLLPDNLQLWSLHSCPTRNRICF